MGAGSSDTAVKDAPGNLAAWGCAPSTRHCPGEVALRERAWQKPCRRLQGHQQPICGCQPACSSALEHLSSLTAFRARVNSTAFSKGCRAGSKLCCTLARSCGVSLPALAATLLMHLTFIHSCCQPAPRAWLPAHDLAVLTCTVGFDGLLSSLESHKQSLMILIPARVRLGERQLALHAQHARAAGEQARWLSLMRC